MHFTRGLLLALVFTLATSFVLAADRTLPPELRPWQDWALWNDPALSGPRVYSDGKIVLPAWPSRLDLQADLVGGAFQFSVMAYAETDLALPGDADLWPQDVTADGVPAAVVSLEGRPTIHLTAGQHQIAGMFRWPQMPQRIALPASIGLVRLTKDGQPVENPDWDAAGFLWLQRAKTEKTERDSLTAQVYRLIEDGLPIWLHTEVELSVTGRSREEDLGTALPEGWQLAQVEAPIPVAVDDAGRMKAQVRAGKWKIALKAFRTDPEPVFRFPKDAQPMVASELVALQPAPRLRVIEIEGLTAVDVSQTTFPAAWRQYPLYAWPVKEPFKLVEKMRGMGYERPAGLAVTRQMWLDENGAAFTWEDTLTGQAQKIWRLDVAKGRKLGAAKIDGESQLITRSPKTGAPGVEVRKRNLNLEAVGRADRQPQLAATGWQADAASVNATLQLPPGWRALAVFGPEWVQGDWLRAWTLLDLFFLMIFAMTVGRVWGWMAGLIALGGFVLSYHEPGAPRFMWLALLVPLLLRRVVPPGKFLNAIRVWTGLAIVGLILVLVPFLAQQIQSVLYPQSELQVNLIQGISDPRAFEASVGSGWERDSSYGNRSQAAPAAKQAKLESNLLYDKEARIQTGPAVPNWSWRTVTFGWSNPVAAEQTYRPVLIPPLVNRVLILLRLALLLALVWVLLRRWVKPPPLPAAAVAILLALTLVASPARAEIPDQPTLQTLRERLLQAPDAFPGAAEIPTASVTIADRRLILDAEIHAAAEVAVPLPGRLPSWSPLSVTLDGQPAPAVMRRDGYLWIALLPGVHRVRVEGTLPDAREWELNYPLKPMRLTIDAPQWTVTGLRPTGVPEATIFFSRKESGGPREVAYDRKDYEAIVEVQRRLELGLVWQVRTTVRRLSPRGKAIALSLPLLPGERILTADRNPSEGRLNVRLGANEDAVSWDSELPPGDALVLQAEKTDRWVETWSLVASPVWNVVASGIEPVFEADADLVPVWHPWPGESVTLAIARPAAVPGETVTVSRVELQGSPGAQQRTHRLELSVNASLGHDFAIDLPSGKTEAEITELTLAGNPIPIRKEKQRVLVPIRPGEQEIVLAWRDAQPLEMWTQSAPVALPVESANITLRQQLPGDRWLLWANGPLRGPAVRFWPVLILIVIVALVLGRLPLTPLRTWEWLLLLLGLTQVHLLASLFLIGWLFLLAWRGTRSGLEVRPHPANLLQVLLVLASVPVALILLFILHRGLLGHPEMYVLGGESYAQNLTWYEPRSGATLPLAGFLSVSVWWYRGLMLLWALWLARSFLRWVPWGWQQFSAGGLWKKKAPVAQASSLSS